MGSWLLARARARRLGSARLLTLGVVLVGLVAAAVAAKLAFDARSPSPGGVAGVRAGSILEGETVRMLIVGDPFSSALKNAARELGERAGGAISLEIVGYDDMHRLTLLNARDERSAYDLVSFDSVWTGEYGEARILLPLDHLIAAAVKQVEPKDFLEIPYRQAQYRGVQLGLPIQPHPELLWYRKDLFAADGIAAPATIDDVLAAAAHFTRPESDRFGICWNGQRGQALGQQIAHFYAAFGQPLLDVAGRPTLDTPRGIAAARYALSLLPFSPPDVLAMAWDQRPRRFAQGGCVMTYEWAARTYLVEEDPTSLVAGRVGYTGAPVAPPARPMTSLGTWSLGIPANIGPRKDLAWRVLAWLTSSENERYLARRGNGGMPRYSVLRDPELVRRYPAFAVVERLSLEKQLDDWMRPAVPEWSELATILGTVYHDMLSGSLTPEEAARRAQEQADALFRAPARRRRQ